MLATSAIRIRVQHGQTNGFESGTRATIRHALLRRASLIKAAGKGDWKRLPEMLDYLGSKDHDEIYATSLVRLLRACDDASKWPAMSQGDEGSISTGSGAAADSLAAVAFRETSKVLLRRSG